MKKFLKWAGAAIITLGVFPLFVAWAAEWMRVNGYMPTAPTDYWGDFSRLGSQFSRWVYDLISPAVFIWVLLPFAVIGMLALVAIARPQVMAFYIRIFHDLRGTPEGSPYHVTIDGVTVANVGRQMPTAYGGGGSDVSKQAKEAIARIRARPEVSPVEAVLNGRQLAMIDLFVNIELTEFELQKVGHMMKWTDEEVIATATSLKELGLVKFVVVRNRERMRLTASGQELVDRRSERKGP